MTKFEASLRFFTMRSQLFPIDQFLYINKSVKFREKYIHIFVDIINTCYLHSLSLISIHKNLIVCVQKFYIFFLSTIMFSLINIWQTDSIGRIYSSSVVDVFRILHDFYIQPCLSLKQRNNETFMPEEQDCLLTFYILKGV